MNDLSWTHCLLIACLLVFAIGMIIRAFSRDRGGWRRDHRMKWGEAFASSSREYRIPDPPTRSIP